MPKLKTQKLSHAHTIDVTTVTGREEIARAFGERTAWEMTIAALTKREAKERTYQKKLYLRLMLLNAYEELKLINAR